MRIDLIAYKRTSSVLHSLIKETTHVEREFKDISKTAEGGYIDSLARHYGVLVKKQTRGTDRIQAEMTAAVGASNPAVANQC